MTGSGSVTVAKAHERSTRDTVPSIRLATLSFVVLTSGIVAASCGGGKNGDGGVAPQGTGGSGTGGSGAAGGVSTGGGPGAGGSGVSSDAGVTLGTKASADFSAHYIAAACRQYECLSLTENLESCRNDFFNPGYLLPELVRAIDDGRILYDASKGGECYAAVAKLPCNGPPPAIALQDCFSIIKGTVPAGGACLTPFECADRACHQNRCSFPACCLGVCGAPFASGAVCESSDDCEADERCAYATASAATKTCGPYQSEGQPCDSSTFCASNLSCDSGGSHTCKPRIKDGAACSPDGPECESMASYCDPATGKCKPRIPVGGACTVPTRTQARYDVGCVGWAACIDGVCANLPAVGAACSTPDGGRADYACRIGGCINGLCQSTMNQPCTMEIAQSADAGTRD